MKTILFLIFLILTSAYSVATPALLSPELESFRQNGSRALLDLNYEDAKFQYEQMINIDPRHPAGYIYLAHAMWQNHLSTLRLLQTKLYSKTDAFFRETNDEVDPVFDNEFQRLIRTATMLSEARIEKNENDIIAMYYLGMAKNTLAGYEATVRRDFHSALKNGSKGVSWHRKVVKLDPSFVDAKVSIGLYKYVVGSLPFFVKILAFIGGISGSKKEGIQLLEEVYEKGSYSNVEAGVLLMMLYERQGRPEDALKISHDLVAAHPSNFLFRMEKANLLVEVRRVEEGRLLLERLFEDPSAYEYMPDLLHFRYAETMTAEGRWAEAYEHYTKAADSSKAPDNLITMSRLGAAKSLDSMMRHDEARAEYRIILKRKDFLDSHDQAKKFLKKPFSQ